VRTKAWRSLLLCLALVGTVLVGGCAQTGDTDVPDLKVLFIGNSFTFYNGGIDQVLHGLAPRTQVDSATQGGYKLSDHLADQATMTKLRQPGWNRVVLQEQSQVPVWSYSTFVSSAATLAGEVRKTGATPLLMMTWARPDSKGVTTAALASAFADAGKRLKTKVIPAGTAFGASLKAHPQLALNVNDGHPTKEGTYLAGCVTFATIFGKSPVGNTFTGGLDAEVARTLQEEAARAVLG
jgi:hypothetical protein